jgi:hypothetical protein
MNIGGWGINEEHLEDGKYLAWKFDYGSQVRVGQDAMDGCGENIFLLEEMITQLQELGVYTLNRATNEANTNIWSQGWSLDEDIGLEVRWNP